MLYMFLVFLTFNIFTMTASLSNDLSFLFFLTFELTNKAKILLNRVTTSLRFNTGYMQVQKYLDNDTIFIILLVYTTKLDLK